MRFRCGRRVALVALNYCQPPGQPPLRGDPTMSLRKFAAANHVNRPRILANSIREFAYASRMLRESLRIRSRMLANPSQIRCELSRMHRESLRTRSRTLANPSRMRCESLRIRRESSRIYSRTLTNSRELLRIRRELRESVANYRELCDGGYGT